MWFHLF